MASATLDTPSLLDRVREMDCEEGGPGGRLAGSCSSSPARFSSRGGGCSRCGCGDGGDGSCTVVSFASTVLGLATGMDSELYSEHSDRMGEAGVSGEGTDVSGETGAIDSSGRCGGEEAAMSAPQAEAPPGPPLRNIAIIEERPESSLLGVVVVSEKPLPPLKPKAARVMGWGVVGMSRVGGPGEGPPPSPPMLTAAAAAAVAAAVAAVLAAATTILVTPPELAEELSGGEEMDLDEDDVGAAWMNVGWRVVDELSR